MHNLNVFCGYRPANRLELSLHIFVLHVVDVNRQPAGMDSALLRASKKFSEVHLSVVVQRVHAFL